MENLNQGKRNNQIEDSWKLWIIGFIGLFASTISYLIFTV